METIGLSNSITIASIVITLVSIAVSVAFALRRRKYPGSIMFIREEAVALLDDFVTRLPNLTVLYKDVPVGKNLVLLRGYLLNNGSIDITPDMAEQPLTVTLPDGCVWLEFTLTGTAEALHAEGKIFSPTVLQIIFAGQFRRDEAFSFQALVTVDAEKYEQKASSLAEALHWSHRIANLGKVKLMTVPATEKTLLPILLPLLFSFVLPWIGANMLLIMEKSVDRTTWLTVGFGMMLAFSPWCFHAYKEEYRPYRVRKKLRAAMTRKPGPEEGKQPET